jgi:hypothetical protein
LCVRAYVCVYILAPDEPLKPEPGANRHVHNCGECTWRDTTCGHSLTRSVHKQEMSAEAQVTGWGCFDDKLAIVPGTQTLNPEIVGCSRGVHC